MLDSGKAMKMDVMAVWRAHTASFHAKTVQIEQLEGLASQNRCRRIRLKQDRNHPQLKQCDCCIAARRGNGGSNGSR